jgi:hypothetical protein
MHIILNRRIAVMTRRLCGRTVRNVHVTLYYVNSVAVSVFILILKM